MVFRRAPLRILTPDAQHADDGVVERSTSGPEVLWDIYRERGGVDSRIAEEQGFV